MLGTASSLSEPMDNLNTPRLPTEILIAVFELLNPRQLTRCRLVSKQFDHIITHTTSLQYLIELASTGYEDEGHSLVDIPARFDVLRTIQRSWNFPQPQAKFHPLDVPLPASWDAATWTLVEGIFIRHACTSNFDATHRTRIDAVNIHEIIIGLPPRPKTLFFEMATYDSQVCPREQLIVLIGLRSELPIRMYLRSLIDGQPHPRASQAIIELPPLPDSEPGETRVSLQDMEGDFLFACVRWMGRVHLHLFNWPLGILVHTWERRQGQEVQFEDALIPRTGYVLLAGFRTRDNVASPFIRVYSLDNGEYRGLCLLAEFALPRFLTMQQGLTYWNCRHSSIDKSSSFGICSSRHILLHLRLNTSHSLFAPLSTLLTDQIASLTPNSPPLHVPWHLWGPQSTRLVKQPEGDALLSGYRVIYPEEIWDFTPLRPPSLSEASLDDVISSPEILDAGQHVIENVETCLPYRRVQCSFPQPTLTPILRAVTETGNRPRLVQVTIGMGESMYIDTVTL